MKGHQKSIKKYSQNKEAAGRDNVTEITGNEIDEIITRMITETTLSEPDNGPEKDVDQHRSILLECFESFHLHDGVDPSQIAKAWKDAENTLSSTRVTNLEDLINQDIEKIVAAEEMARHRSILIECFEAFHLQDEGDPLQIATAWKDAEAALPASKFANLQDLVNQDIEKIVTGQTVIRRAVA